MKISFYFTLFLSIIFISFLKSTDSFEGTVHYTHRFVSLDGRGRTLEMIYGTENTFQINRNGSHINIPDILYEDLFYLRKDSTIYYMEDADTLHAESASLSSDSILSMNIADTNIVILGHACKRFTMNFLHKTDHSEKPIISARIFLLIRKYSVLVKTGI